MLEFEITEEMNIALANPLWYRDMEDPELQRVTNLPMNLEMGLQNIILFAPTDAQQKAGIVCSALLKMISFDLRIMILQEGNALTIRQHHNILFHKELIAQVLRHIETQIDIVVEDVEPVVEEVTPMLDDIGLASEVTAKASPNAGHPFMPYADKRSYECDCDGSQYLIVDDNVTIPHDDITGTRIVCCSCKSTWIEPNF